MSEVEAEITTEAAARTAPMTLILGNKNYSSWSMRAGLAAEMARRNAKAEIEEILIPLDQAETRQQILAHSPSGLVPALLHGGVQVWDSLAIVEYLAEVHPAAGLWPADRRARAVARAVSAEMHSGFLALRGEMSMDIRKTKTIQASDACKRDIARICRIWQDCRSGFGADGDFLFGAPSAADCMYAPVASRFRTYGVELDAASAAYVETLFAWGPMADWVAAAEAEPWDLPNH
jgi:glutathione S-transferase